MVSDTSASDSESGEYVNSGPGFTDVVDDDPGSHTVLGDACEESLFTTGGEVIAAGLLIVDLGEAGSVYVDSAGSVGATIDSARDNAMGGSQEPRQSNAQLAQAGSMLLT